MSKRRSSEQKKKIILAVAMALLAVVVVYQLFFSSPPPKPRARAQNSNSAPRVAQTPSASPPPSAPVQTPRQAESAASRQEEQYRQLIGDLTPLNLSQIRSGPSLVKLSERGNIFAYYVPPPPPPPPPPKPPPITLQSVQPQSAVATTPRAFNITVTGIAFPPDAQILFGGRPKETKRVSETVISTEITPAEYTNARNVGVQVKSQSDPSNWYSNEIPFIIQPAPEPPFKYIGRIGEKGLFEMTDKRVERLAVGSKIQGVWQIDSINDAGVEVTQTQYGIKKRVPMADKIR